MQIQVAILLVAAGGVAGAFFAALGVRRRQATRSGNGSAQRGAITGGADRWLVDVRAALAGVPFPVVIAGEDGRIVYVNEVGDNSFGELAAKPDPVAWSSDLADLFQVAIHGDSGSVSETIVFNDPQRSLRVATHRIGEFIIATLIDVTEDVDFEEARRTFSSAVSHELRTPLARILGLAETLALPGIEDEREGLVVQIELEVDGMRRLIDEMLLLAALDRGRLAVADGVVDASSTTLKIVEEVRQRRISRGRVISSEIADDIELPVAARLFEVVVQNLIDNALIHGGADASVMVTLSLAGDTAMLIIRDDGVGINAYHLPYVFQRFYRGDASRTGPGSGLGLALVKHIVEAHGGSVAAESDGVSGTVLSVRLPVV